MMTRIPFLLVVLAFLAGCSGTQRGPTPAATPGGSAVAVPTVLPPQRPTTSALPPATPPSATVTPDDAAVGFAVVAVRDGDLWLKHLPAGKEVPLTDVGDVVDFPEFSPDGRLILFRREGPPVTVSREPAANVPISTLWAVPVAGGAAHLVLDPLAALPAVPGTVGRDADLYPSEPGSLAWLPDARHLLLSTRYLTVNGTVGNYDLWRLDVDSGQLHPLLTAGQGGRPTLSPDGASVLLSSPTEIAIARVDGSERNLLLAFEQVPTYSEWEWVPEPVWNGDGTVYVAIAQPWTVGQPVTYDLWRLEPTSSQKEVVGHVQVSWLHTPLWSPDRSRLAYIAADGGLVLATGTGQGPRPVAAGDMVLPVAWSPAGTRLAFVQDGQHCVVDDRDDAAPICLAAAFYGDARWLDEDSLVIMVNAGEDQPRLMAVELPSGTATELWSAPPPPVWYDLYLDR